MGLLIFWAIIFVIVLIHEFGHLIVAKKFGVRVTTYSIGFGPRIIGVKYFKGKWSFKILEYKSTNENIWNLKDVTEYRIAPIPFGGFCAMEGETTGTGKEHELVSKPFLQKFLVAIAGVTLNILSGISIALFFCFKKFGFINGFKYCLYWIYNLFYIFKMAILHPQITHASEMNTIVSGFSIEEIITSFAVFSIFMGLLNLIPFPCLDGSLPFLWILEKIFGKKSERVLHIIWFLGFVILMILQIVIFYLWIFGK